MKSFLDSVLYLAILFSALLLTFDSSAFAITKGLCSASSLRGRNNSVSNYRVRCERAQTHVAKYQGIVEGYQQQLPNATDARVKKSILRNINLNTSRLAAAQRSTNISCARFGVLFQAFEQRKAECLAQFPNTVTPTPGPTLSPAPASMPVATPTPFPTHSPTPTPIPTYYICSPGSPVADVPNGQLGVCAPIIYY